MKFHIAASSLAIAAAVAAPAVAGPLVQTTPGSVYQLAAYDPTVRDIQAALNDQGYDAGPADGLMGSRTRSAIAEYQRKNNLLVTGQASISLLSHIRQNRQAAAPPAASTPDPEAVRAAQERLAKLGYSVATTGVVDAQTRAAIGAFQRDNGLPVDGVFEYKIARQIRDKAEGANSGGLSTATLANIERGLDARGYDTGVVDGQVDAKTRAAIAAYQRDRGDTATGQPSQTLADQLAQGTPEVLNTPENIAKVQSALNERGYSAGPADGVMGPSTRSAIQAYRRDNGLDSSADVTADLLESLAGGAPPAPAAPNYAIVMSDDFEDGDYTVNPSWSVHSGTFRVADGYLIAEVPQGVGEQAVVGVLGQALGVNLGGIGAIAQGNDIANGFEIRTQLLGAANRADSMHLGPYLGNDIVSGYRLVYEKDANNRLSLVANSGGTTTTLASKTGVTSLGDGRRQNLVWTRDGAGLMTVSINNEVILETTDQSITGGFNGYSFVATEGAWNVHSVSTASLLP